MENKYSYEATYEKWRKMIFKTNKIIVFFIFLIEFFMYLILNKFGLVYSGMIKYYLVYCVIPTGINILTLVIGNLLESKIAKNSGKINYITVIELEIICFVIACIHCFFSVTLAIFCIPMLTTIIYGDKKMTRRIFGVSFTFLLLTLIFKWLFYKDNNQDYVITDAIVAFTILISAYFMTKVLMIFQKEKNDILEKSYKQQIYMQKMIDRDQKTSLYNHTMFMGTLNKLVSECLEDEKDFSLAIIDIDNFKSVNDEYGHSNGDKVLINLADIILKICSDRQFPARFGGEEFTIIFDERSSSNAYEIVEEIREKFMGSTYEFTDKTITISCGIALYKNGWTSETIFNNADSAMYKSKTNGKNQTTIFKENNI